MRLTLQPFSTHHGIIQPVFTTAANLGMVMGFRVGGADLRRIAYDLFRIA